VLIGLPSTGLNTNGYSLAKAVLLKKYGIHQRVSGLGMTLAKALLAVHRSYLKPLRPLLGDDMLHGLAHITGGGIVGNTMRVLPRGLRLNIDWQSWERPALFRLIGKVGEVPEEDMRRTFNLGIGLVAVVGARGAGTVLARLRRRGESPVVMGEVSA
jgi:phosphoribosylformylglycinamidine cyclo-ligase